MSQRLFSTLFAFVLVAIAVVVSVAQGVLPAIPDLLANLWTLIVPAVAVLLNLNAWLDVLDSKVANGDTTAGDVADLFTMPDFWTVQVAIFAGAAQALGIRAIDQQQQALLINGLLAFSWILLRSFTDRTPKAAQAVAGKFAQAANVTKLDNAA